MRRRIRAHVYTHIKHTNMCKQKRNMIHRVGAIILSDEAGITYGFDGVLIFRSVGFGIGKNLNKKKCGTRCLREVLSANGYQLPFAHRTYSPRRNLAITTTSHLLQAHLHYPQQLAAHPIELRPHSPYRNPATSTTSHLRQAHLHYPQHLAPDKFLDT